MSEHANALLLRGVLLKNAIACVEIKHYFAAR